MINSVKETKEHLNNVTEKLKELAEISAKVNLPAHASIFYGIAGMFCHSPEAVNILADSIQLQVELLVEEMDTNKNI